MIIQLPHGATSIVLRFDAPDAGQVVTLLPAPAVVPRQAAPRRRTMLACGALGMVVAAVGVSFWNGSPRGEAVLNLPRPTAWNREPAGIPPALQAELDRAPAVVPPAAAEAPQAVAQPGRNPFGLE